MNPFQPIPTAPNQPAIVAAVESQVSGYFDATRRRDVAWLLNFWADVPEFVIAGDGKLVAGYEEGIAQPTRDFFAGIVEVPVASCRNGRTYVLSPDAAVHTTEYEWTIVRQNGDTLRAHGAWTYVFKRFGQEWKVVHSAGTHLYT